MASCNYKLLKDTHIGLGIRMTKDKNTIPFANEPMKGMKIVKYSNLGFFISHPNMGKDIWVEFKQLPLTQLTIVNGIIQDEITFVENIVAHQMELIKTDNPEYQELLKVKEQEKFEEFVTLSNVKPGEVVISALCKEGIAMTYLGTWYSKNAIRYKNYRTSYNTDNNSGIYLSKTSPQRAFFIVDSEELSPWETEIVRSIEREDVKRMPNEDHADYYKRIDEEWKTFTELRKNKENELRALSHKNRYKIIAYPISSKRIQKLIKTNVFNERFTDLEFNKNMILSTSSRIDHSYYGDKERQSALVELKDTFNKPEYSDFLIVNNTYDLSDINYLDESKEGINKRAYNFINDNFKCKLKPNKVAINNQEIEDLNFLN